MRLYESFMSWLESAWRPSPYEEAMEALRAMNLAAKDATIRMLKLQNAVLASRLSEAEDDAAEGRRLFYEWGASQKNVWELERLRKWAAG